jgi:hypothetical protein
MKGRPTVIFDVDGVLADNRHRLYHIMKEPKDWASYWLGIMEDKPIEYTVLLTRLLSREGFDVVVFTARPQSRLFQTTAWLNQAKIPFMRLWARDDYDGRSPELVKKDMLDRLIHQCMSRVFFAVEDHPPTVDMYRSQGVPCLAADPGHWNNPFAQEGFVG